ncbi:hypothetical protein OS493_037167 [Desmophyllum pertusum]|uniref:non-specific serine/threonine protein kinase n=1 Tax=Desmophyllum pertusum TaxID=174260 RepID=A0A9W9Z718_9CNID|nr:hypothetical protein OS493_037167 [Desmophyllum pertusum]
MIRFSSCNTSEEKKTPKIDGFALFSTSSGSVSSFNDDDYEVDENSDEEEQEEPGITAKTHCGKNFWMLTRDLEANCATATSLFSLSDRGYHPVRVGDLFNNRYSIIRKLGWGHFSTVWLAWDVKERRFVALKIVKSASHYTETAIDEMKLLRTTLQGLDYLHSKCKIIHTDIKPENILLCVSEKHVQQLAAEAAAARASGLYSPALISTAPPSVMQQCTSTKISKNKKKKMKKKLKKQIEKQQQQQDEIEQGMLEEDEEALEKDAEEECCSTENCVENSKECVEQNVSELETNASQEETVENHVDSSESVEFSEELSSQTLQEKCVVSNDDMSITEEQNESDVPLCNGDSIQDSNNVDMESLPEQKEESCVEESCLEERSVEAEQDDDDDAIRVKIADLGNACWVHHHFTEEIQTRQYRSLEVLIGASYGPPADMWSTACMAFELATGDFLFEPHSGEDYSRDEDHLAHVIELLGKVPRHIALSGKYSRDFFNKKGELKHISKLRPWGLYEVLREKYEWPEKDAVEFSAFLLPMLDFNTEKRVTAVQCLDHPWLKDAV